MGRIRSIAICLAVWAVAMSTMAHDSPRVQGSFKHPIPFQNYALVGDGVSVRVVGTSRPAELGDGVQPPGEGQEYVVVLMELTCDADRSEHCAVASWDFELAGDNGIVYPNLSHEYERAFEFAPNTEVTGHMFARVSSDDKNLVLLVYHWPTIPYTFPLVFATEAAPEPGPSLAVNATIGMIARAGPSKSLDFTGVFNRDEQVLAQGRTRDGGWLEIAFGWIPAELVNTEGDIMSLPVTFE